MINSQGLIICCLLFVAVLGGGDNEENQRKWLSKLEAALNDAKNELVGQTGSDPVNDWINLSEKTKFTALSPFSNCLAEHRFLFGHKVNGDKKCAMQICRRIVRNQYLFCRISWAHNKKERMKMEMIYENGDLFHFINSANEYENSGGTIEQFVKKNLPTYNNKPCDSKIAMWGATYQIFARKSDEEKKEYLNYFEKCLDLYCNKQQTSEKIKHLPLKSWRTLPEELRVLALGPFDMYLKLYGLTPEPRVNGIASFCAITAFIEIVANEAENYTYLLEDDVELLNKYRYMISNTKAWDFLEPFYAEIGEKSSEEKLREILVDLLNEHGYDSARESFSSSQSAASTSTE